MRPLSAPEMIVVLEKAKEILVADKENEGTMYFRDAIASALAQNGWFFAGLDSHREKSITLKVASVLDLPQNVDAVDEWDCGANYEDVSAAIDKTIELLKL